MPRARDAEESRGGDESAHVAETLRPGVSGAKAVQRAVRSEAKQALDGLSERWPPADEAIHEARKRIKRARAGLRLLRENLGERVYRRENAALRNAARPLSEVRDAKILIDALDQLAGKQAQLDRKAIQRVRATLVAQRMRARRRVLRSRDSLAPVLRGLRSARKRLPSPAGARGWTTLGPSLRRVYRSGRRAAVAARQRATDEKLHESRKQAKYLWHELQILAPIEPAVMTRLADLAHRLSERLGDDHDLAVLRGKIVASRSLSPSARRPLLAAIDRRRASLQRQAQRLGRRLYRERPRAFERRLGCHWRAWRSA